MRITAADFAIIFCWLIMAAFRVRCARITAGRIAFRFREKAKCTHSSGEASWLDLRLAKLELRHAALRL